MSASRRCFLTAGAAASYGRVLGANNRVQVGFIGYGLIGAQHVLDCIGTRQKTIADVEDGHLVAVACHLANISLRTGRKLRWDPDREEIIGDREAAQHLARPYRKPWDEVLRSFKL